MLPLVPASWELVPDILAKLRTNWPDSKTGYNMLNGHGTLRVKFSEHEVILLTPGGQLDPYGTFIIIIPAHRYELHGDTLCPDLQVFADALVTCPHIDWSLSPQFSCVHERLFPILDAVELLLPTHKRMDGPDRAYLMTNEKARALNVKIPDDLRLGRLTEDDADFVNARWRHGGPDAITTVRDYIKFRDCAGLFNKDTGALVAWCLHGEHGGPAMLQVAEEYRRRGYGEVVLCVMTRRAGEMGLEPQAFIRPSNEPSMALFRKLGYEARQKALYTQFQCPNYAGTF